MKPIESKLLTWIVKVIAVWLLAISYSFAHAPLLNASYDATREFYQEYNAAFAEYYFNKTQQKPVIRQSHGSSSKQARSVMAGLEADVVTLGLAHDIDVIATRTSLISRDWQARLPHHSAPYTSTVIFLVRKGNPKGIKDWDDLIKPGVSVITPNPKTSGSARWNYMAGWGYALLKSNRDESKAREYMTELFKHVPVLDSASRGATTTFVERGMGDVLLNWENEILLAAKLAGDKVEVVVPSTSILAEPAMAVVDKVAEKHGTTEVAQAYLAYLHSEKAQEIAAKHFFRPVDPAVMSKYTQVFPSLTLFTLEDIAGDWQQANTVHFAEGGTFDQIYQGAR